VGGAAGEAAGGVGSEGGSGVNSNETVRTDGGDEETNPGTNTADADAQAPLLSSGYILGADISGAPEQVDRGMSFVDTDGETKDLLELLAAHGFNMIRLRTFVDPGAAYGYASDAGDCQAKAEAYTDLAHTVAFAQRIKAAGFGLLLDLHYSDTWADPGKQVIPEAWRGDATVEALAAHVSSYTSDVLTALIEADASPDMVQVGNEITPGMLIHVPSADTDCYGNNSTTNAAVNGSTSHWDDLAQLLSAGINAVREVDPRIQVMLHIENLDSPQGVVSWVNSARDRGVDFDVLGLSAYEAFQGPSSSWQGTFEMLAETFPELKFAVAEYNPQRRLLNDIVRGLPESRGVGTFFWEPTQSGSWGDALFDFSGNQATAREADFAEYDQIVADYGL
jgi:arabinogalactan endo-1,4-beta-galactosidase